MDLRKKLLRLTETTRPPAPIAAPAQILARPEAPVIRGLPLERRETEGGVILVRDALLAAEHAHGSARVAAALEVERRWVAALSLDARFREVPLEGMLLLDTETTGLAGGTGTLPFLLGLGWFEEGRLRVVQLFLSRPGEEGPMLRFLEERLAKASCVVSFNGKSFDWPLLRNRFVMNRLTPPEAPVHLDLLHCARRVYRHRGAGARLVQLEREVLGFHRVGDVPGEEIPERYFTFLRDGEGAPLEPVLTHNAQDLILLAALLGVLGRELAHGQAADPRDGLGYAYVTQRAGEREQAERFATHACAANDGTLRAQAHTLLADHARRGARFSEAITHLEEALALAAPATVHRLHLELSKLYEHRAGDPSRALFHAERCARAEPREANARRLLRLSARLARSCEPLPLLEPPSAPVVR